MAFARRLARLVTMTSMTLACQAKEQAKAEPGAKKAFKKHEAKAAARARPNNVNGNSEPARMTAFVDAISGKKDVAVAPPKAEAAAHAEHGGHGH